MQYKYTDKKNKTKSGTMYIINKEVEKMEKIRIKNNKKNVFYMIIGKILTYFIIWGLLVNCSIRILELIIDNCITTL